MSLELFIEKNIPLVNEQLYINVLGLLSFTVAYRDKVTLILDIYKPNSITNSTRKTSID